MQIDDIESYFKELRFDNKSHLGLGDIRLTIGQQEDIINYHRQFVSRVRLAFNYLLHEIADKHEDSLAYIANDAFIQCNLPFKTNEPDYPIDMYDWDQHFKK